MDVLGLRERERCRFERSLRGKKKCEKQFFFFFFFFLGGEFWLFLKKFLFRPHHNHHHQLMAANLANLLAFQKILQQELDHKQ